MNESENLESQHLTAKLAAIQGEILALAQNHQGEALPLLSILRSLEAIHSQIREDLFLSALPDNRHNLTYLLRDIEETGGWPYIERMRLQALLSHFEENSQKKD
ncbi:MULTISPECIES: hypothetical protein [Spirulina sp. CCY15215]|uniref:hypothetical protein n=1 Tax=Spirulina sp. CCY15215 TaxID=2767591 RepID=UPI001EF1ABEF|nr:hypothetical protein [Spirulina major]